MTEAGRQDPLRWLTIRRRPAVPSAGLLRIFLLGEMPPTRRGSTSRRSRTMPTPSWPATRRCGTPSRGAKATRTSTPGRRWSSVSAGRRWRPTGPGGYSRRLTADPLAERCIAIVSDISLPYRKRSQRFLSQREAPMDTPFPPVQRPATGPPRLRLRAARTRTSARPPALREHLREQMAAGGPQDGPGRLRPRFGFGPGFGPGFGFGPGGRGGRRGHGRGRGWRGDVAPPSSPCWPNGRCTATR